LSLRSESISQGPSDHERMFGSMTRPREQIAEFEELRGRGWSQREISAVTGIPLGTIRKWARGVKPKRTRRSSNMASRCLQCGIRHETVVREELPAGTYSYLLGLYLGDGDISRNGSSFMLRLTLDTAYPGIISEAAAAMEAVAGRQVWINPRKVSACAVVGVTWGAWPCLFPQHGPGRKHSRRIALERWQQALVLAARGGFVRGLIQPDGWRGLNRVHVKGRDYAYPRYQFSNRSADIRGLFTWACDALGVDWRPWGRYHVSVARRDSVALLDRF